MKYRNGMVIVHGSAGGMPEFVQVVQMCIIKDEFSFIFKKNTLWYHEHFRAFELIPTREIWIIPYSELKDPHPLADYKLGHLQMFTLKRFFHCEIIQWIIVKLNSKLILINKNVLILKLWMMVTPVKFRLTFGFFLLVCQNPWKNLRLKLRKSLDPCFDFSSEMWILTMSLSTWINLLTCMTKQH